MNPMIEVSTLIATADKSTEREARKVFGKLDVSSTGKQLERKVERLSDPAAQPGRWRLVIFDLQLPETTGFEMVRKIRAAAPNVAIFVLCSAGMVEETAEAMRLGADDFLTKPVKPEELRDRVLVSIELKKSAARLDETTEHGSGLPQGIDPAMPHLVEKLRDPSTGRLDARRIADFFGVSVSDLARAFEKRVGTVSKTPDAPSLQEGLRRLEAAASGLLRLTGSERRARMWLQAVNPALDKHAPVELLQLGKVTELSEFIQDMLEGRPS